jgi:hypoxanthine phosphoribosyltransferase
MSHRREQPDLPVLIDAEEIRQQVEELGRQICADRGKETTPALIVVGILTGAFVFLADLVRTISCPVEIDFVSAASYGDSTESSGEVVIRNDLSTDIKGRDVLVVDGIFDTGATLSAVLQSLELREPKSLKCCVLLDKPARRRHAEISVDYIGFEIADEFVVGYGLDFDQRYRNLTSIHRIDTT